MPGGLAQTIRPHRGSASASRSGLRTNRVVSTPPLQRAVKNELPTIGAESLPRLRADSLPRLLGFGRRSSDLDGEGDWSQYGSLNFKKSSQGKVNDSCSWVPTKPSSSIHLKTNSNTSAPLLPAIPPLGSTPIASGHKSVAVEDKRRAEQRWQQLSRTERRPDESAETLSMLTAVLRKRLAGEVDKEAVIALASSCFNLQLEMGEKLCVQGELIPETCSQLFVLEWGSVCAYKDFEIETRHSAPGIIDAGEGYKPGRWGTTVIAKEPLSVWSIDRADVKLAIRASKRRRSQMLQELNPKELAASTDKPGIKTFRMGEIIAQRSALKKHSYVLLEGGAVAKHDGHVLKRYVPGDCFGESTSKQDAHASACLIATTDCVCAVVRRESELPHLDPWMMKSTLSDRSALSDRSIYN